MTAPMKTRIVFKMVLRQHCQWPPAPSEAQKEACKELWAAAQDYQEINKTNKWKLKEFVTWSG